MNIRKKPSTQDEESYEEENEPSEENEEYENPNQSDIIDENVIAQDINISALIQEKMKILGENLPSSSTPQQMPSQCQQLKPETIAMNMNPSNINASNNIPFQPQMQQLPQMPYQQQSSPYYQVLNQYPNTINPYNPYMPMQPIIPQQPQIIIQQPNAPQNINPNTNSSNKNNNTSTEQELMSLKVKCSNLESENSALKEKLRELCDNNGNESVLKNISNTNNSLKSQIDKYKSQNNQEKSKCIQLQKNNEELRTELKIQIDDYEKLWSEKNQILKHMDQMKNELNTLKKEKKKWEFDNNSLYEEKNLIETKYNDLTKELKKKDEMIRQVKDDYNALNQRYFTLKRESEKYNENELNRKEENFFFKGKDWRDGNKQKQQNYEYKNAIQDDYYIKQNDESKYNNNNNNNQRNRRSNYSNDNEDNGSYSNTNHNYIVNKGRERDHPQWKESTNIIETTRRQIKQHQNNISELSREKMDLENELFKLPDTAKTTREKKITKDIEKKLEDIEQEINYSKTQIRKLNKELNN